MKSSATKSPANRTLLCAALSFTVLPALADDIYVGHGHGRYDGGYRDYRSHGDTGVYAGIGAGASVAPSFCDGLNDRTCDDSDFTYKAFGGFRFNRNVGLEATYQDFGNYGVNNAGVGNDLNFNVTGLNVQALLIAPIDNQSDIFAKLGVMFWNLDTEVQTATGSVHDSQDGNDFSLGFGAKLHVADALSLRLDWDYIPNLGDRRNTGEEDVMAFTAGFQFDF